MRSVPAVTVILTVLLLATGSIFFRPTPPPTKTVLAAETTNHPVEQFWVDSSARSVVAAFAQAGVPYFPEDKVTAFPEPRMGLGSVVTVTRAMPVVVQDGKKTLTLRTWQESVGGLVQEKKLELGAEDRVAPSQETALVPGLRITVTRVARTQVVEKEIIAYQTVIEKDYNQFVGAQKVIQAGKNGEKEKTFLLIREDGELISKTLLKTVTTIAPQTQKVQQGGLNPVSAKCAQYKDWVVDASKKNGIDPNALFYRMQKESNCNPNSQAAAGYQGMLQYDPTLWVKLSKDAGFAGASIWDAKAQIYTTAWAWAHGHRSRWPNP
jgi:hypothetical protein